ELARPRTGRGGRARRSRLGACARLALPSRAAEERAIFAVTLGFELACRDEAQRRRVDAVPKSGGRRAVVEDVSEVRVGRARPHFGTFHPEEAVFVCRQV